MDGHSTGGVHCYDVATNSWTVIGEMPTPRYNVLPAVLPTEELVVVGGISDDKFIRNTDIGLFLSFV